MSHVVIAPEVVCLTFSESGKSLSFFEAVCEFVPHISVGKYDDFISFIVSNDPKTMYFWRSLRRNGGGSWIVHDDYKFFKKDSGVMYSYERDTVLPSVV